MAYISEEEYKIKFKKIQEKNKSKERKRKLKEEDSKCKYKKKLKLPSTSKLVLLAVFLMCIEILVFAQYAMIKLGDISAMYTLIGVPVTLVPVVLAYYSKSRAENTKDGLIYDKTMLEMSQQNKDSDDAQG